MKTKLLFKDSGRRSYAPPVVSTTLVQMQGVLCESTEADFANPTLGWTTNNDLSGDVTFEKE